MLRKPLTRLAILVWIAALTLLVTPIMAQTSTPVSFPLAAPGPYSVGLKTVIFTDTSRQKRRMTDYVWYPAVVPANPTSVEQDNANRVGWLKAEPDVKAAPYPLILISPGYTQSAIDFKFLAFTLVSQGFVVVGLAHPNEESPLSFVNRPMDVLYVLDQLAAQNQSDFGGVIDTDHVGVMGDSYGAYTTLAITGARIDPVAASAITAKPFAGAGVVDSDARNVWSDWNWDKVTAYRSKFSTLQSGELWPPVTDKRIKAALMMSVCWIGMFGEKGLAAASVPSLIVGGVKDPLCHYDPNDAYAFAHLGSQDRYLLTMVNGEHVPGFDDATLPFTTQMITAFFGYYLQGQQDDIQYLTEKYVGDVEVQLKLGLVWGPYTK